LAQSQALLARVHQQQPAGPGCREVHLDISVVCYGWAKASRPADLCNVFPSLVRPGGHLRQFDDGCALQASA
jgi:hypothetical protein